MRILITNDDGINAPGLEALADIAAEIAGPDGEVWTVAPAFEQSGVGHCISYAHPTLIAELARRLSRSEGDLAEDIGAWVARIPTIRRLLRFAAPDFAGFMTVLPEMGDRITMVVRGFELPRIRVRAAAHGWCVAIEGDGVWPHVLSGILHAMADDYGVLAVISVRPEGLSVSVPLTDFSEGRPFSLSDPMVGLG